MLCTVVVRDQVVIAPPGCGFGSSFCIRSCKKKCEGPTGSLCIYSVHTCKSHSSLPDRMTLSVLADMESYLIHQAQIRRGKYRSLSKSLQGSDTCTSVCLCVRVLPMATPSARLWPEVHLAEDISASPFSFWPWRQHSHRVQSPWGNTESISRELHNEGTDRTPTS